MPRRPVFFRSRAATVAASVPSRSASWGPAPPLIISLAVCAPTRTTTVRSRLTSHASSPRPSRGMPRLRADLRFRSAMRPLTTMTVREAARPLWTTPRPLALDSGIVRTPGPSRPVTSAADSSGSVRGGPGPSAAGQVPSRPGVPAGGSVRGRPVTVSSMSFLERPSKVALYGSADRRISLRRPPAASRPPPPPGSAARPAGCQPPPRKHAAVATPGQRLPTPLPPRQDPPARASTGRPGPSPRRSAGPGAPASPGRTRTRSRRSGE